MKAAQIVRSAVIEVEHAPAGVKSVHGVTHDGERVWFAHDDVGKVVAIDPGSGDIVAGVDVPAGAGVAFDGTHLWVVGGTTIRKVDRKTGKVLATIPAPDEDVSGLTWHDGALWAGGYRSRKLRKLDPATGRPGRSRAW